MDYDFMYGMKYCCEAILNFTKPLLKKLGKNDIITYIFVKFGKIIL